MKALLSDQGPEYELTQCDRLGKHDEHLRKILLLNGVKLQY